MTNTENRSNWPIWECALFGWGIVSWVLTPLTYPNTGSEYFRPGEGGARFLGIGILAGFVAVFSFLSTNPVRFASDVLLAIGIDDRLFHQLGDLFSTRLILAHIQTLLSIECHQIPQGLCGSDLSNDTDFITVKEEQASSALV